MILMLGIEMVGGGVAIEGARLHPCIHITYTIS